MNRSIPWFLVTVLAVDAVAAALMLGVAPPVRAQPAETPPPALRADESFSVEALALFAEELNRREVELRQREARVEELMRSEEVLRRAQALEIVEDEDVATPVPAGAVGEETPARKAFARLSKAYESMEPDSAAIALNALAELDQEAVVQLVVGWTPRTSGAILDALTQQNPGLAAALSYEIWKRSGKSGTPTAISSR